MAAGDNGSWGAITVRERISRGKSGWAHGQGCDRVVEVAVRSRSPQSERRRWPRGINGYPSRKRTRARSSTASIRGGISVDRSLSQPSMTPMREWRSWTGLARSWLSRKRLDLPRIDSG